VTTWAGAAVALAAVLWRIANGFDLTDEASYVLASDPPDRGDAFNGLFGLYLRPLWQLTGWDVGLVRAIGVVVLAAAVALLGASAARLLDRSPGPVVAVAVAASTGLYGSGLRTPSYTWVALLGATVTCAALLRLLSGGRDSWGTLAGAGVAVAAVGKVTTGAGLALLVLAVPLAQRRPRALAAAVGALVAATLVHVGVVLDAPTTLRTLRRSAAMLAAVDPEHYTATGAVTGTLAQLPRVLVLAAAVVLLACLPALRAPAGAERPRWLARHAVVTVIVAVAALLASQAWSGGFDRGVDLSAGLLPVLAAVAALALTARRMLPAAGSARAPAVGVLVLVIAAFAVAAGTNVSLGWVLGTTGTVLLAPACLLAARTLPAPAATAAVPALLVGITAGAVVTAVEAHGDPKRAAPLASATVPVRLGPVVARVDGDTAAAVGGIVDRAGDAGWRSGDRLVDTTFTPAVPLALGAVVPPVLVPGFPGLAPDVVCVAVRDAPGDWSAAWLLVPRDASAADLEVTAHCLGRHADDYEIVSGFATRWAPVPATLLRPRPEAAG
jgi:hypothetical protein